MNLNKLMLAALVLAASGTQAKVKLPHLISDGMVIQQDADVRLWGWADKGKTVTVTTSWDGAKTSMKSTKNGTWELTVHSPKASFTPLTLTFDDGDGTVTVGNILAGEVWVCAGQSNMEMPVKGFGNCPVEGYNQWVLDAAGSRGVRSVKIPSAMSMTPLNDADCAWRECSPQTVGDFSATGYFFARLVSRTLNIPVGLIEANKGGSRVESWLDADNIRKHTQEPMDSAKIVEKFSWDYHRPLLWGNGTFHPILNYTVKGILFYQGCSNVGDPGNQYSERLKLLVEQWRRDFRQGELPFYFVQIAPYAGDHCASPDGDWLPRLQEQQYRAAQIIPNSALICTNDLVKPYEGSQIHPTMKQPVGERLGFIALNKLYGMKQLICDSPYYKSMTIKGDTCFVQLDGLEEGISRYEDLQGFELAGDDHVFHPAHAYYYWTQGVVVTSKDVPKPVAVRYCFRNWQLGNVKNQGGLPLFPFRSDDW